MTAPSKKHLEFAYILALVMVLIAGWGLYCGKLTGAEWVTFSGIISGAYGLAEVFKNWPWHQGGSHER